LKRTKAIKEALGKLPKTLDETYERILLQLSGTDSEDNTDLLRKMFIFLAFGKRPMTLPELAQAVTIDVDGHEFDEDTAFHNPEDLVTLCQPLVALSPTTGHLGFVHYSVQEFLLSDRLAKAGSEISVYALDPKTAHTEIARICLSFLDYDDFAAGPCTSYEDFNNRTAKFPFLKYAASQWRFHATEQCVETELTGPILKLLIPQKNPKLASMIQNSTADAGWGNDVICFVTYLAKDGTERMYTMNKAVNSLALAAVWGLDSVLSRIVESGADINLPGGFFGNALQCAAYGGHITTAKILLDLGAEANYVQIDWTYGTPLMTAILVGRQQMIDLLLERGVDVNVGSGSFYRPLSSAAFMNDIPTMKRLIEVGADIDYGEDKDAPGQGHLFTEETALGMAVSSGKIEAALFLIQRGASFCGRSIIDVANCISARYYPQTMPVERVESLVQGLAALGHHIEVDHEEFEEDEEESEYEEYEEDEEESEYEEDEEDFWNPHRPRAVKFRLKLDRAPVETDRCGAEQSSAGR
jgi:hypothetical protein